MSSMKNKLGHSLNYTHEVLVVRGNTSLLQLTLTLTPDPRVTASFSGPLPLFLFTSHLNHQYSLRPLPRQEPVVRSETHDPENVISREEDGDSISFMSRDLLVHEVVLKLLAFP